VGSQPFKATGLSIQPCRIRRCQIASLAMADTAEGQAYRYAIYKLNSFTVTAAPSSMTASRPRELNRYNPATGSGTSPTIPQRPCRHAVVETATRHQPTPTRGDTFVKPQSGTPFYFEDFTSNAITQKCASVAAPASTPS